MIAHRIVATLAMALLASSVGCQSIRKGDCCDDSCDRGRKFAFMKYEACCEHCGGGFGCGGSGRNDACGSGCCEDACCDDCSDTCCDGSCDACAGGDCGRCIGDGCGCQCRHKTGWFRRACKKCGLGCAGCGEFYWSEWHNEPPACCEPCDCHGNYTGPGQAGYYRAPYRVPDLAM